MASFAEAIGFVFGIRGPMVDFDAFEGAFALRYPTADAKAFDCHFVERHARARAGMTYVVNSGASRRPNMPILILLEFEGLDRSKLGAFGIHWSL